jgi:hypothetical protein
MDYSFASDHRWRRLGRAAAWMLPLWFGTAWTGFWILSCNVGYATLAASLVSGLALISTILTAGAAWSPRLARSRRLNAVTGSWAALPALIVTLIARARGLPVALTVGLGVVAGAIASVAYARHRPRLAAQQQRFHLTVDTLSEAELVEAATQAPGRDPGTADRQQAMERLNRARALAFLAMRQGDFDRLIEALPVLRATLQDRQLDPAIALIAGRDLMEAHSLLVQYGGDPAGYGDSVELFAQLVTENAEDGENLATRAARSLLHEHRTGYEQCVLTAATRDLEVATRDHDQDRARQAYERMRRSWHAVEAELRAALQLAPGGGIVVEHLIMLGAHLCTSLDCLGEDRCDEGVDLCRRALALRAGRTREQRPRSQLYLAQCLVMRGEQFGDERDLDEAEALLGGGLARPDNPVQARACRLMLELAVLRHRGSDPVPVRARAAFAAGLADAVTDLIQVGDLYLEWASAHGTVAEQAEAAWMRSVVTAREAWHRGGPASRLAILARSQPIAAEAGYWLAADGRVADAVTAIEHSRAILLTRLTGGMEPRVRAALLAAGEQDLLGAYLTALHTRAGAYRRQYSGTSRDAPALSRGSRSYQAGAASDLEAAEAAIARLARRIEAVTGPLDPLELPRYDEIRAAARPAPVVYLAAAERGGYALVVPPAGEPIHVPLPALRASQVRERVDAITARPLIPRAVSDCVRWLSDLIPAIEAAIPGQREVVLLPLGALNLLPVNAAFIQVPMDRAAGPPTVRFAPNARVLASAPGQPGGRLTGRLLLVEAANAPGAAPLPRSRAEAAALARRYGGKWLPDATRAAVLSAMDDPDLVHFLCHGQADLADPLSSALLLADGRLTVRDLFARSPLRRQLVILTACESQLVGSAAPDEMIGLPAALIQAGAFGVIAAQWPVDERAALLVLRRFYECLDAGTPPARALTLAQDWLRTATLGELTDTYPDLFDHPGPDVPVDPARAAGRRAHVPYDRPVDWAAFTYTGM